MLSRSWHWPAGREFQPRVSALRAQGKTTPAAWWVTPIPPSASYGSRWLVVPRRVPAAPVRRSGLREARPPRRSAGVPRLVERELTDADPRNYRSAARRLKKMRKLAADQGSPRRSTSASLTSVRDTAITPGCNRSSISPDCPDVASTAQEQSQCESQIRNVHVQRQSSTPHTWHHTTGTDVRHR